MRKMFADSQYADMEKSADIGDADIDIGTSLRGKLIGHQAMFIPKMKCPVKLIKKIVNCILYILAVIR